MSAPRPVKRTMQNPFGLLIRAMLLWVTKRIRFERDLANITLNDHGELFKAFRKIVVEKEKAQPTRPTAVFKVRFRFKNLSHKAKPHAVTDTHPIHSGPAGFSLENLASR